MANTKSLVALVPLLVILSCSDHATAPVGPTNSHDASLIANWQRDDVCWKMGVDPWNNFWFRADTFEFTCMSCGFCDSAFTEFPHSTRGTWYTSGDALFLKADSSSTVLTFRFSVIPSSTPSMIPDSLILTDPQGNRTVYRKVRTAFPVENSCGGMVFMARIGSDFATAADSLLRMQYQYATSHLIYDSTRITSNIRDTLGRPYLVLCYQVCIYDDSLTNLIHSCGDVIDSTGNWFIMGFCPD